MTLHVRDPTPQRNAAIAGLYGAITPLGGNALAPPSSLTPTAGGVSARPSARGEGDVLSGAIAAGRRPAEDTASFSPESQRSAAEAAASQTGNGLGADAELTTEEQQEVQQLKQRDTQVRQHEQAHLAAGGQYVRGGASFEYTTGPDGRRYATGGEVSIDVGSERTPEATIRKAQAVRRAALAPAEPSGQDRSVAAQAAQLETKARQELARAEGQEESGGETAPAERAEGEPEGGVQQAPASPPGANAAPSAQSEGTSTLAGAVPSGNRLNLTA